MKVMKCDWRFLLKIVTPCIKYMYVCAPGEVVVRFLLQVLVVLLLPFTALKAVETKWEEHQGALKTRIIAASGELSKSGKMLLGWEADLAPGWKAYWRSPGEAGLPVTVYANDDAVEVLYPFPERFELFGLETYGYSEKVILPFYVNIPEAGHGVSIKADFMVCKDICIPFTARYQLPASGGADSDSLHDVRLKGWLAKIPDTSGDAGAGLDIESVTVKGMKKHQKLVVDVVADRQLASADLLVEAGSSFHFGSPKVHLVGDGTKARIVVGAMAARGAPDLKSRTVRLTFSDGFGAVIDRTISLSSK